MGQKIHPIGFRLGPLYTWTSRWFANSRDYHKYVIEDSIIRKSLMAKLHIAGIARVEIERSINKMDVIIFVSKPGLVIGRGGTGLDDLKKYLLNLLKIKENMKNAPKIDIRVEPIKEPNLDAYLVATNISDQLIKRMQAKRAMNQALEKVMQAGAKGARIILSGRIGGAEIARREKVQSGVLLPVC